MSFKDLCTKSGIIALHCTEVKSAPVLRWTEASEGECRIPRSPFWTNVIGYDANYKDLNEVADNNSTDDNLIILITWHFVDLLKTKSLDIEILCEFAWEDFGDWAVLSKLQK